MDGWARLQGLLHAVRAEALLAALWVGAEAVGRWCGQWTGWRLSA